MYRPDFSKRLSNMHSLSMSAYLASKKYYSSNKGMPTVAQGYARAPGTAKSKSSVKFAARSKYIPRTYSKKVKGTKDKKQDYQIVQLKKQVRDVRRSLVSDQANHTNRIRNTYRCLSSENLVGYLGTGGASAASLETAVANLRYYNPSSPGTLVTADASTGTYTRQVFFKLIYSKLTVKNNYQVPARITVYTFVPRADTSVTELTFYQNGVADQGTSLDYLSPLMYPTDIKQVTDNWKLVKTKKVLLLPGKEVVCTYAKKNVNYDPSSYDSHSLSFQEKYGAHRFLVRCEGTISHDITADEQGIQQAGVDICLDRTHKITYDAGVNLDDYSYTDGSDAFTNNPVVSQPVVDNQDYSVN